MSQLNFYRFDFRYFKFIHSLIDSIIHFGLENLSSSIFELAERKLKHFKRFFKIHIKISSN